MASRLIIRFSLIDKRLPMGVVAVPRGAGSACVTVLTDSCPIYKRTPVRFSQPNPAKRGTAATPMMKRSPFQTRAAPSRDQGKALVWAGLRPRVGLIFRVGHRTTRRRLVHIATICCR